MGDESLVNIMVGVEASCQTVVEPQGLYPNQINLAENPRSLNVIVNERDWLAVGWKVGGKVKRKVSPVQEEIPRRLLLQLYSRYLGGADLLSS